jgi:hypothetical protein
MTELVTIPGVPILRVGMGYPLASGKKTFTEEDIAAAANAYATDPAVKAPRIKIDAVAKAMGLDPEAHGGEPAFGWFDNLRVSADGQELIADAHTPDWVAAAMEWAYPSLSVEGPPPGWTSPTGRTHELVITAVALLGTDWPGCTTLDDFRELLAKGPALAEEPAEVMVARMDPVRASLDSDIVVRRFLEAIETGTVALPDGVRSAYDLWPRSLRFDDSGSPYLKVTDEASGRLFRCDVSVSGNEATFSDLAEIVEQDVPIAAAAKPSAPVASWSTREAFRLAASTPRQEDSSMTDEQRRAFARALGLPEDTTEARLHEVAAERAATTPADPNAPTAPDPSAPDQPPPPEQPTTPVTPPSDPSRPSEPTPPAQPAQPTAPEGLRLVDESTLADIQRQAAEGAAVAARMRVQDRDQTIRAAIGEGRFSPARREHWERAWDRDPDGTRHLLTAKAEEGGLAPGLVPVTAEIGASGDGEGATPADEGTGWFTFNEQGA